MTKKKKAKPNKTQIYTQIIHEQTKHLWESMVARLESLPEGQINYDTAPREQQIIIEAVDAIEREWILDDEVRESVSLLDISDNDE